MPSPLSRSRLNKAFNEGRRSAVVEAADNPYDNPKLRSLWEQGRTQQRAGELTSPIPPLEHGETRAQRPPGNSPEATGRRVPAPGTANVRRPGRGRGHR